MQKTCCQCHQPYIAVFDESLFCSLDCALAYKLNKRTKRQHQPFLQRTSKSKLYTETLETLEVKPDRRPASTGR